MLGFSGLLPLLALVLADPALANDELREGDGYEGSGGSYNHIHGIRIDVHGNLDGWGLFGLGGRAELALISNGLLRGAVHDELALSLGADFLFAPSGLSGNGYDDGGYAIPIAALQWNIYIGDRLSIFPEAGVALHVGFDDDGWNDNSGRSYGWLYAEPALGLGARLHLGRRVALLLRVGTPGGVQLGLNF